MVNLLATLEVSSSASPFGRTGIVVVVVGAGADAATPSVGALGVATAAAAAASVEYYRQHPIR